MEMTNYFTTNQWCIRKWCTTTADVLVLTIISLCNHYFIDYVWLVLHRSCTYFQSMMMDFRSVALLPKVQLEQLLYTKVTEKKNTGIILTDVLYHFSSRYRCCFGHARQTQRKLELMFFVTFVYWQHPATLFWESCFSIPYPVAQTCL